MNPSRSAVSQAPRNKITVYDLPLNKTSNLGYAQRLSRIFRDYFKIAYPNHWNNIVSRGASRRPQKKTATHSGSRVLDLEASSLRSFASLCVALFNLFV